MKTTKLNDYKKMNLAALEVELKALKQELFKLRFSHAMNGLDNPQKMVEAKKNIARVNTIITMIKLGKEIKVRENTKQPKAKVAKKAEAKKAVEKIAKEEKVEVKKEAKKAATPKKEVAKKTVKKETKEGGND